MTAVDGDVFVCRCTGLKLQELFVYTPDDEVHTSCNGTPYILLKVTAPQNAALLKCPVLHLLIVREGGGLVFFYDVKRI